MIDIIIPTNKHPYHIKRQLREMHQTTDMERYNILTTHLEASSPTNRNHGLIMATSDIAIMCDDDLAGFTEGWADRLVEPLKDESVIMVSARLMKTKKKPGVMMDIPAIMDDPLYEVKPFHDIVDRETGNAIPVKAVPSACIAFRRDGTMFDQMYRGAGFEDSVTGDMPVIINRNGYIETVPIEDLYDIEEDGRRHLPLGVRVWSRDGWTDAWYCYKHTVNKKIYRIRTKNGLICVTGDHSLFSGGIEVKPSELNVGDKIDLAELPSGHEYPLKMDNPFIDGLFVAEGTAGIYYKKHTEKYTQKICQARIHMQDEPMINRVVRELGWSKYQSKERNGNDIYIASLTGTNREKKIKKIIAKYYSNKRHKIVPVGILNNQKDVLEDFLYGYTVGDGHIEQRKKTYTPRRSWSTKSMALALGVQYICKKLNINTSVNTRKDKIAINIRENTGNLGSNQAKACNNKPPEDDGTIRGIDDVTHLYADKDGMVEVYDVNTTDGNFVAGLGGIIAHNTDFCFILCCKYPNGRIVINNECKIIHKNEMKNQLQGQLHANQLYFRFKWGLDADN